MTCDRRDQELLLLAHGALSLPRSLAVRAHLRRCDFCRQRYTRLAQVSSTLAGALSAANTTPWTPAWGVARTPPSAFRPRLLLGLSALLLAVICAALYLAYSRPPASCNHGGIPAPSLSAPSRALTTPDDPCRN